MSNPAFEREDMDPEIADFIKDLRHAVTVAGLNYEIWWTYVEKESRAKYVDAMNRYSLFFQTSIHAHFVSLVIALYRLYETNARTVNVPRLLGIIKEKHPFSAKTEQAVEELAGKVQPLFQKVAILRNNVFGHRSAKLSTREAFAKAGITPDQLKEMLETTKELMNQITHEWDQSVHAFNLGSGESIVHLLDDLVTLEQERSNKRLQATRKKRAPEA